MIVNIICGSVLSICLCQARLLNGVLRYTSLSTTIACSPKTMTNSSFTKLWEITPFLKN